MLAITFHEMLHARKHILAIKKQATKSVVVLIN